MAVPLLLVILILILLRWPEPEGKEQDQDYELELKIALSHFPAFSPSRNLTHLLETRLPALHASFNLAALTHPLARLV